MRNRVHFTRLLAFVGGLASSLAIPAAAQAATSAQVTTEYSFLDHGYQDWEATDILWNADLGPSGGSRGAIGGELDGDFGATRRFGLFDQTLAFRYLREIGAVTTTFETSFSPSHRVMPFWTGKAGVGWPVGAGWVLSTSYKRSAYDASYVNLGTLGLSKYFGPFRLGYTLFGSDLLNSGFALSHLVGFSWYYGDRSSLSLLGAFGSDLDALPQNMLLVIPTQTVALVLVHSIDKSWALTGRASWQAEGDLYTRSSLLLGVSYQR